MSPPKPELFDQLERIVIGKLQGNNRGTTISGVTYSPDCIDEPYRTEIIYELEAFPGLRITMRKTILEKTKIVELPDFVPRNEFFSDRELMRKTTERIPWSRGGKVIEIEILNEQMRQKFEDLLEGALSKTKIQSIRICEGDDLVSSIKLMPCNIEVMERIETISAGTYRRIKEFLLETIINPQLKAFQRIEDGKKRWMMQRQRGNLMARNSQE